MGIVGKKYSWFPVFVAKQETNSFIPPDHRSFLGKSWETHMIFPSTTCNDKPRTMGGKILAVFGQLLKYQRAKTLHLWMIFPEKTSISFSQLFDGRNFPFCLVKHHQTLANTL
jgi:hypothetical protein